MDVIEAIKKRQSLRSYKPQKVPRELIKELLDCAHWAPSACNLQLTEYIIVDDEEILSELKKQASSKFSWSPTFIIFIYDTRFSRRKNSSSISLGANMENLLLAATNLGLTACPITGFRNDKIIKKILKIPKVYEIGLIMAIGYANDNQTKEGVRIPLEKVFHWNSYDNKENLLNDSLDLNSWSFADIINYRQRLAPVYFYKNRFNLHVFSRNVYQSAFRIIKEYIKNNNKDREIEILDLISYDCLFLKYLSDLPLKINLTAADYFSYPLKVIKDSYPNIKTSIFTGNHKTDLSPESFDIITLIHKIEFTPNIETVFKEISRLLKPGGILYVTTSQERIVKRILNKLKLWKLAHIKKQVVNVYENNPFYKIGPISQQSSKELDNLICSQGFIKHKSGFRTVTKSGLIPHRFYWGIYKKQS